MSIRCTLWVWSLVERPELTLTPTQLLVLLAMADQARDSGLSWASSCYYAKKTGLNEKTIRRTAKELVVAGLLMVEAREGMTARLWLQVGDFTVHFTPDTGSGVRGIENRRTPDIDARTPDTVSDDPIDNLSSVGADAPTSVAKRKRSPKPKAPAKRLPARQRFCPEEWMPSAADIGVAQALGFDPAAIERELIRMRNHEFANPRSDWSRVWRNWVDKTAETRSKPNGHDTGTTKLARSLEGAFAGAQLAAEAWRQR